MHMTRQWIAATFDSGPDAGPAERSDAHDRHWTIQLHHARCWLRLQPPKVLNQLQHLLLSRRQILKCRAALCPSGSDCLCSGILKNRGARSIVDDEGRHYAAWLDHGKQGQWLVRVSAA